MGFTINKTVYELVETGVYSVHVASVVYRAEGKFGPEVKITFGIDDSDVRLTAWSSAIYTNKSKLGRWVQAILGGMPEQLDLDALVGKPCRISVLVKVGKDGSEYNKIDEILPPTARKARKPQPQPEPESEEEESDGDIPF